MKARADRERGGGVRVLIVSLIKPWEAQGGWEMRWEVSELNVRSGRDVADFHEAYAHTHWEVERGSSAQSSVSYYPLNFSSPSRSIAPLSLCHSPSFALPIFHPLHPNYWCHCKLNCCSRVVTFPLKSPNRYLSWWKWRLFPSLCDWRHRGKCRVASSTVTKCFHQRLWEALKFRLSPLYLKHSPLVSLPVSSLQALLTPLSICFLLLLLWVEIFLSFYSYFWFFLPFILWHRRPLSLHKLEWKKNNGRHTIRN